MQAAGGRLGQLGALVKRTHELTDDQVGELMDAPKAQARDGRRRSRRTPRSLNYYEQALRDHRRLHRRPEGRATSSSSSRRDRSCCGSSAWRAPTARGHQLVRIHPGRDHGYDRGRTGAATARARPRKPAPSDGASSRETLHEVIKILFITIGAILAAMIVIPLTILAGLFVWLKLTEETDDEEMEIEDAI